MTEKFQEPRVNEKIRAQEIRLIGDDGKAYGVVTLAQAKIIAESEGLDLIEISPNAKPPVVKLMDYGKYKYQVQKRAAEAKKKQVVIDVKEVKFRPNIEKHDLDVKMKNIDKFLDQGDKVKLLMQFRGREMAHKDIGLGKFNEILKQIAEKGAVVESAPKFMGNRVIAMIAPGKKK
ncbi:MAG TPA: translation initiation factor IF-3 [Bacteriovoracaceae bacterium]|nr:translation initiation factor IF-3 [Bacteriovoracaceae bacterium]